ncbi:MAG: molybdopterin converting factor subunit 1 [Alphaproteobacteria bacterium]
MTVLYFAWVRQKLGISEERVELPAGVRSVRDLTDHLRNRNATWSDVFSDLSSLCTAVNQEHVSWDAPIAANDEVAFFPPVTGG